MELLLKVSLTAPSRAGQTRPAGARATEGPRPCPMTERVRLACLCLAAWRGAAALHCCSPRTARCRPTPQSRLLSTPRMTIDFLLLFCAAGPLPLLRRCLANGSALHWAGGASGPPPRVRSGWEAPRSAACDASLQPCWAAAWCPPRPLHPAAGVAPGSPVKVSLLPDGRLSDGGPSHPAGRQLKGHRPRLPWPPGPWHTRAVCC